LFVLENSIETGLKGRVRVDLGILDWNLKKVIIEVAKGLEGPAQPDQQTG